MADIQTTVGTQSASSKNRVFPPDIVRLLDILVSIERRRQARLRALRTAEKC